MTRCPRCGDVIVRVPHVRGDATECDGVENLTPPFGYEHYAVWGVTGDGTAPDIGLYAQFSARPGLPAVGLDRGSVDAVDLEAPRAGPVDGEVAGRKPGDPGSSPGGVPPPIALVVVTEGPADPSTLAGRLALYDTDLPPELANAPLDDEPASAEELEAIAEWRAKTPEEKAASVITHEEVRRRMKERGDVPPEAE